MIHLITGQPGAGKTLYALHYILALSGNGKRDVYYDGITDLKLPWIALPDPAKWFDCPAGSIVVMDEAQALFRPRGQGSRVPDYVQRLETHRHQGLDIVLITQHPMLVDTNIRRLVGRHFHLVRKFGMQAATAHEFMEVRTEVDKPAGRAGSIRHEFKYPKESYGWYKSAEIHTHKRRIPFRVYFLFGVPLLIGACIWGVQAIRGRMAEKTHESILGPVAGGLVHSGIGGRGAAPLTTVEYVKERIPRLVGFAQTAPAYDQVTAVKHAPFPASCVQNVSKGCWCWTQQATRLPNVSQEICKRIVEYGYFVEFDDETKREQQPRENDVARENVAKAPEMPSGGSGTEPRGSTIAPALSAPGQHGSGYGGSVGQGEAVLIHNARPPLPLSSSAHR